MRSLAARCVISLWALLSFFSGSQPAFADIDDALLTAPVEARMGPEFDAIQDLDAVPEESGLSVEGLKKQLEPARRAQALSADEVFEPIGDEF